MELKDKYEKDGTPHSKGDESLIVLTKEEHIRYHTNGKYEGEPVESDVFDHEVEETLQERADESREAMQDSQFTFENVGKILNDINEMVYGVRPFKK